MLDASLRKVVPSEHDFAWLFIGRIDFENLVYQVSIRSDIFQCCLEIRLLVFPHRMFG